MKINFGQKQNEIIRLYQGLARNAINQKKDFTESELIFAIENKVGEFKGLNKQHSETLHTAIKQNCLGYVGTYKDAFDAVVDFQKRELREKNQLVRFGFDDADDIAKGRVLEQFFETEKRKVEKRLAQKKQQEDEITIKDIDKYFENTSLFFFTPAFRAINSTEKLLNENEFSFFDIPNKAIDKTIKVFKFREMSNAFYNAMGIHKETTVLPAARKRLRNHSLRILKNKDFTPEKLEAQFEQTFRFLGLQDKKERKIIKTQIKDDSFEKIMLDTTALLHSKAGVLGKGKLNGALENQMALLDNYKTVFRKTFTIDQMQKVEQLQRLYTNQAVNSTMVYEQKQDEKKARKNRKRNI